MRLVKRPERREARAPLEPLALQPVAPPDAVVARIPDPARAISGGSGRNGRGRKRRDNCQKTLHTNRYLTKTANPLPPTVTEPSPSTHAALSFVNVPRSLEPLT